MQNARDQLPDFRYHPDLVGTGSISATPVTCACCGQQRPFSYTGPVYATEELDNELCPWCIADGRAAAMFDAQFTDVTWRVPEDVPEDVTDEILTRTPGFAGWQQEHWMHHCSDAAEYHGTAGAPELAAYPDALDWVRRQAEAYRWPEDQVDDYLRALRKNGDATAYLFRCGRCGTHLAYSDFSRPGPSSLTAPAANQHRWPRPPPQRNQRGH